MDVDLVGGGEGLGEDVGVLDRDGGGEVVRHLFAGRVLGLGVQYERRGAGERVGLDRERWTCGKAGEPLRGCVVPGQVVLGVLGCAVPLQDGGSAVGDLGVDAREVPEAELVARLLDGGRGDGSVRPARAGGGGLADRQGGRTGRVVDRDVGEDEGELAARVEGGLARGRGAGEGDGGDLAGGGRLGRGGLSFDGPVQAAVVQVVVDVVRLGSEGVADQVGGAGADGERDGDLPAPHARARGGLAEGEEERSLLGLGRRGDGEQGGCGLVDEVEQGRGRCGELVHGRGLRWDERIRMF